MERLTPIHLPKVNASAYSAASARAMTLQPLLHEHAAAVACQWRSVATSTADPGYILRQFSAGKPVAAMSLLGVIGALLRLTGDRTERATLMAFTDYVLDHAGVNHGEA